MVYVLSPPPSSPPSFPFLYLDISSSWVRLLTTLSWNFFSWPFLLPLLLRNSVRLVERPALARETPTAGDGSVVHRNCMKILNSTQATRHPISGQAFSFRISTRVLRKRSRWAPLTSRREDREGKGGGGEEGFALPCCIHTTNQVPKSKKRQVGSEDPSLRKLT